MPVHHLVAPHVLTGPDETRIVACKHIRVDHPAEDLLHKAPTHRITLSASSYSQWAEHSAAVSHFRPSIVFSPGRQAPVHVLVPLGNAGWNPLVKIRSGIALGSCVHSSHENEFPARV